MICPKCNKNVKVSKATDFLNEDYIKVESHAGMRSIIRCKKCDIPLGAIVLDELSDEDREFIEEIEDCRD